MHLDTSLAIIGASCRLPGADTLAHFADMLLAGIAAIGELRGDRWTKSRYFHPTPGQAGKTYTFAAGALQEIDTFDAAFFGISPREAPSIDPQQRIMLEVAYEAIEDAGIPHTRLAGSGTGVYVGASSWDHAAVSFSDAASLDTYGMQGAALSSVSNRISYIFDLHGPSLTVDTACSSSLVALHLACEALRRGEIDQALVGGVNLLLAPQSYVGFARASMLSRLGKCHSFDARADGYVRGEGASAIVIKTLARAIADGDTIRAVIRGTGVNSDGRTAAFPVPSRKAQAALLRDVSTRAGVAPDDFCYFEAHGTGTPVGDPIEAHAIGEALAQFRTAPLPIGSVKSNIGHLEPASGMAGLMKLLVTFERGVIPPSLNFETPNPNIPFGELNLQVVTRPDMLPLTRGPLIVGINSFGFGGTNAHAILATPPEPDAVVPAGAEGATSMPLLLSARSTEALRNLAATWRDTIKAAPPARVPALLRAAARRRDHQRHRLIVNNDEGADLAARLDDWLAGTASKTVRTGQATNPGLAFVYSGNGSQWAGMGLHALRTNRLFAAALAEVDRHLADALGWSVISRLQSDDLAETIRNTTVAQPLLFAIQVAIVSTLRQLGVTPTAHIGHSAGEVAAAWGCGALTLDQACRVIVQRSLAQGATHGLGGMAALALSEDAAADLIARVHPALAIAAVNAPDAVTIAGPLDAMALLEPAAEAIGARCNRLDLDYAFHSAVMAPIQAPLLAALDGLASTSPVETMISRVTGRAVQAKELDADYWWRNVRMPVRFSDAIECIAAAGVRTFLEVGPHPVLQHYMREVLRGSPEPRSVLSTLSRRDAAGDPLANAVAECYVSGADIAAASRFDGPADTRGLPLYPWQRQSFAIQRSIEGVEVVKPVDDHPLLGFRDTGRDDSWMSHLCTATQPWLADHVVDDAAILPAAAMIEMALAAARTRHPDAAVLEIQDLEITRSLPLASGTVRDCRTLVEADGQWSLASRPRLTEEPLQRHAQGRILPGLGHRPVLPATPASSGEVIAAEVVYARARTVGLSYGPAFRTVVSVDRIDTETGVADLRSTQPDRFSQRYLLDPTVVDGSLQALLAMAAGNPRMRALGTVMPWRFGRVRLLGDGLQIRRAVLHLRHIGPRSICADIALTDALDRPVMELIDCWFASVPKAGQSVADQTFWSAHVPSLRQAPNDAMPPIDRIIAATLGVEDRPASMLLADACVTASVHEAIVARSTDGVLPADWSNSPLTAQALACLREEGLAHETGAGWQVEKASELPPPVDIWRSLFFSTPQASAECALLAALSPSLMAGDPAMLVLPPGMTEQAMFASPSGTEAAQALMRGLTAFATTWPAGRCLRIALVGAAQNALIRRVVDAIEALGFPFRLVVLVPDARAEASLLPELARTPGATAQAWPAAQHLPAFDLVLDFFGLSLPRQRLVPDQLFSLLASGGLLLAAEAIPSYVSSLLFGPALGVDTAAGLQHPDAWCRDLRDAGFAEVRHTLLDGAIWPATLLIASAAAQSDDSNADGSQAGLVLFAAPNDPLAAALTARQPTLQQLPIEALREVLTVPLASRHQHVLLLAEEFAEDDDAPEALAELLADIAAALENMQAAQPARLWLVATGSPSASFIAAALTGLRRVAGNELAGLECRCIALEATLPAAEAAERLLQELHEPDDEREILWTRGGRMVPRLRTGMIQPPVTNEPRRLDVLRPGLISSLAWVRAEPPTPGAGEVAIEVHAAALNFRDVMWAQGLLPDEALLEGFSGPSLGLECAGIVIAVGDGVTDLRPGDRVAAVAPKAFATHVVTRRTGVMRMPEALTHEAAATVPVAFMTAAYGLGELARLEPGERVLIHGGAGGVGLAAIQYALHKGAVVYATAGSETRRQMLRMLGVTSAFDSRGTSFVDDILAETDGKGVDVVLNSLSQELMKQSLRLLRPFGRFLEIGKRDLYRNTPIGIRALRHNASYHAIDVDELVAHRPSVALRVLNEISALLDSGDLQPLPYRTFGFNEVVSAFRLMQSSGHIGKVVLRPEPTRQAAASPAFMVRPDGVYIVTGGLSGFGLETARWLLRQGVRRLALLSRRGAATPGASAILAELAGDDRDVRAFACDVAEDAPTQNTLAEIRRRMGPIRGVFHAAMVLDDALLRDLDAARFTAVIRPKLAGALLLDRFTRTDALDVFVLFSSVTTVIGTPGQANYVAANRTLEALAHRRHAEGLPGLAVQWGPIGDAGYLMREERVSAMLAKMLGSSHLRAEQALDALPALLASGLPVVGLANAAWGELRARMPGLADPFWSEMPVHEAGSLETGSLRTQLTELPPEEATAHIQAVLVEEIARILQQPAATISPDQPIQEFGVDSLMAVELQTAIEQRLGLQPSIAILTGAGTLRAIAARLVQSLDRDAGAATPDPIADAILRHESAADALLLETQEASS